MSGAHEHDPVFGCVLWTGRKDADGYGRDGQRKAHIVAWEAAFGPVAEGFELDHLCKVRRCVNVDHLEAVTRAENLKRRSWRYQARRTTCPNGHSMTDAMTTPTGGRLCRTCHQSRTAGRSGATRG